MTEIQQSGPTKDELYEKAQELDVEGRASMNKDELAAAVAAAEEASESETKPSPGTTDGQSSENGGFRVGTVEPEGDTEGVTAPGHNEVNADTGASPDWTIKSRREEEEDQHARREAANALVEEAAAKAERTPF